MPTKDRKDREAGAGSAGLSAEGTPKRPVARKGVGVRPRPERREEWQRDFQRFVREWRRKNLPRPGANRDPDRMARTFLSITRTAETGGALDGLGEKMVPVIVENLGNVAAYTCVVRAFEARPRSPIHEQIPLAEFTLGGQIVLTLQPGEQKIIKVPFVRTRDTGTFIAMVSDPILDPNELTVADWNHRRILLVNLV